MEMRTTSHKRKLEDADASAAQPSNAKRKEADATVQVWGDRIANIIRPSKSYQECLTKIKEEWKHTLLELRHVFIVSEWITMLLTCLPFDLSLRELVHTYNKVLHPSKDWPTFFFMCNGSHENRCVACGQTCDPFESWQLDNSYCYNLIDADWLICHECVSVWIEPLVQKTDDTDREFQCYCYPMVEADVPVRSRLEPSEKQCIEELQAKSKIQLQHPDKDPRRCTRYDGWGIVFPSTHLGRFYNRVRLRRNQQLLNGKSLDDYHLSFTDWSSISRDHEDTEYAVRWTGPL